MMHYLASNHRVTLAMKTVKRSKKRPSHTITSGAQRSAREASAPDAVALEVFSNALLSIAEDMGAPLMRVMREGVLQEDLFSFILLNMRFAEDRPADLRAQVATNQAGVRRIQEI